MATIQDNQELQDFVGANF